MSPPAPAGQPTVRIRPSATADLEQIASYLDRQSSSAADRFLSSFDDATRLLASMPRMGALRIHRGRLRGLRSWPLTSFGPYLIFYLPIEQGIEVMRVLHGARDVVRELGQ